MSPSEDRDTDLTHTGNRLFAVLAMWMTFITVLVTLIKNDANKLREDIQDIKSIQSRRAVNKVVASSSTEKTDKPRLEKYPPGIPDVQFVCPDEEPGICHLYGFWTESLNFQDQVKAADADSPAWTFHKNCLETAKSVRKPSLWTACYGYWEHQGEAQPDDLVLPKP